MGIIAGAISTAAYNADIPIAAFRHNDWRVIINKREILVKDIAREEDAVEVMRYLKDLVEKGKKKPGSEVSSGCQNTAPVKPRK